MESIEQITVGQLVARDYRTAAVFKKYEIDFCCNGNISVEQACRQNKADMQQVIADLRQTIESPAQTGIGSNDFGSWPLDLLADYIEKKHHRYVTQQTPVLQGYLEKLCTVHGDRHPELFEIKSLFNECAGHFAAHMKKEELMLFPLIRKIVLIQQQGLAIPAAAFGTIQTIAGKMMQEHDVEGDRFRTIRQISGGYTTPADGCTTYRLTYQLLKEFEEDLQQHIHLENNILFPKAIELELQLSAYLPAI